MAQRSSDGIVHVLLVDHESKCGFSHDLSIHNENQLCACLIASLLQQWSFRVTMVEGATTALSRLLDDNEKFDVVMENMNSSDESKGRPKVLQYAMHKGLTTVLISDDDKAIDERTTCFLKKPVSEITLKDLWKYVSIQIGRVDPATILKPVANDLNSGGGDQSSQDKTLNEKENDENEVAKAAANEIVQVGCDDDDQNMAENRCKKRPRRSDRRSMVWTTELHEIFEKATRQLGDGKCFPKDIVELMNVPDLTRHQVASHLQNCRKSKRKPHDERKRGSFPPPDSQLPKRLYPPDSAFWSWNRRRNTAINLPGTQPPPSSDDGLLEMDDPWGLENDPCYQQWLNEGGRLNSS